MKDSKEHLTDALTGMIRAMAEPWEIKKILLVATHEVAVNIASRNDYLEVKPLSEFRDVKTTNAIKLMNENFIPVLNPEMGSKSKRKYYNEAWCVCYVDTVGPAKRS